MSKFDERFARQYRYEPPPEFPLASPCSDIVHHLSGPTMCAHTQTSLRKSSSAVGALVPTVTFIAHTMLDIAYSHTCMDSLVRVSRRVGWTLNSSDTWGQTFPMQATIRSQDDWIDKARSGGGTQNDILHPLLRVSAKWYTTGRPPRGGNPAAAYTLCRHVSALHLRSVEPEARLTRTT